MPTAASSLTPSLENPEDAHCCNAARDRFPQRLKDGELNRLFFALFPPVVHISEEPSYQTKTSAQAIRVLSKSVCLIIAILQGAKLSRFKPKRSQKTAWKTAKGYAKSFLHVGPSI